MVMKQLKKALRVKPKVSVDFPKHNEKIQSTHYSCRLGVPCDSNNVEVSVNGNDWQVCRFDSGYWWYDMHNCKKGGCNLKARVQTKEGEVLKSVLRRFKIV